MLVENACRSVQSLSLSETSKIFIINYEALLIDPAKWFNEVVSFLGGSRFIEAKIFEAMESGSFKRKRKSMIYSDIGVQAINDFFNGTNGVTKTVKDCFLHQALAPLPREEQMCFHGCVMPSGIYRCPLP